MPAPPLLAPCSTYFDRAEELKAVQPFVSHHLRLFGVEMCMKMAGHGQAEAGRFLLAQMDTLELEKKEPKFTTPPTKRKAVTVAPPSAPPPEKPAPVVDVSDDASKDAAKKDDAKKDDAKKDDASTDAKADDASKTADAASAVGKELGELKVSAEPAKSVVEYRDVAQTPQEAMRSFALDLYERARAADQPKAYPSPSTSWGVVEAPKVARGLHASAVILDGLKHFGALPTDVQPFQQAAHRRAAQLGQQIQSAFKTESPVPLVWAPVDVSAPFASYKPPPPPVTAAMFPSTPR